MYPQTRAFEIHRVCIKPNSHNCISTQLQDAAVSHNKVYLKVRKKTTLLGYYLSYWLLFCELWPKIYRH